MVVFETEVDGVIDRAPGVKSFRFKTDESFVFRPGQFFFTSIRINGQEKTKHFSFSNSPTEKGYIEFTKRLTGSEFSNGLSALGPGDWARIKAPMGKFIYEGKPEKAAFLTGGIGITPIRSMFRFIMDKDIDSDVILLYGNKTQKDIIFKNDFDLMAGEGENLKVVYTLTSPEASRDKWSGRKGRIDAAMISREIPDYEERTFFLCGPPGMVSSFKDILTREMRILGEAVVTENFTGY